MRGLRGWLMRLGGLFHRKQRDADLAAELASHVQMHVEEKVRAGMTPEEARRDALMKLGGVEQTKEIYRDQRGLPWLETLLQDVCFGARMLRKNPGFTVAAMFTLALGIGANTAMFSVVNTVLLKPLPYPGPAKLVWADEYWPRLNDSMVPNPEYTNWKLNSRAFDELAAYDGGGQMNVIGTGEPERLECVGITANFLRTLGVRPAIGRDFLADEGQPGGRLVVILSDALWKRKLGDPGIIGGSLNLNQQSYAVIGIMPTGFRFPERHSNPDIFIADQLPVAADWTGRRMSLTKVIGRLRPAARVAEARTELAALAMQSNDAIPAAFVRMRGGLQVRVVGLHEKVSGDARPILLILLTAVGAVLLIGCVNVAILQLARTTARERELAVRVAIGAGRGRLIRHLLTEAAWIAAGGGVLGIAVAVAGVEFLRAFAPESFLQAGSIAIDKEASTRDDPTSLAAAVREQVMRVDPEQPVFNILTIEQRVFEAMSGTRFNTTLLGFFGLTALVLAGVGEYGVIAYFVAQRTHEIGIRAAPGASRRDVIRMVMRQGVGMIAAGLLLGLGCSLLVGRFLAGVLYSVRPNDPLTVAGVIAVMGGTSLAACYIPARRAARVDPMVALRYE